MEVVKDVNFTGDIQIDGTIEHYNLDLYVPSNSDVPINRVYDYNVTRDDSEIEPTEAHVAGRRIEPDVVLNRTSQSNEFMSDLRNHYKTGVNPFVIFIHGGGWRRGDRDAWKHYLYHDVNFLVSLSTWLFGTYGNVGESLAQNGISCAVISYPLTELGTPWLLFEMLASYIQSCIVTFVTLFISITLVFLYRMVSDAHSYSHWSYMHGRISVTHWREKLLLTVLVTNMLTACLFTFRRNKYKLTKTYVFFLWICMIVCSFPHSSNSTHWLDQIVLVTFLGVQYTIMCLRLRRSGRSVRDQVKVVTKAIKWVERSYGRSNTDIYVMGHSAGGHLACLTAIEGAALEDEGCSITKIKGVISISGVYDVVRSLNKTFLRSLYLHPTFGYKESHWQDTSPLHLIQDKTREHGRLPPFLLISAEKDLFLKHQSHEFYKTLQEAEVDCSHVEIKRTNHFTVIVNFKQSYMDSEYSAISEVTNFILR